MEKKPHPSKRKSIKQILKKWKNALSDPILDIIRPDPFRPPRSMTRVSRSTYKQSGMQFKDLFIQHANLQPNHKVLDIGCGTGRMAVPLTQYLAAPGEYWGLDIDKDVIQWCQERISSRYSQFHFVYSPLYNKKYSPEATIRAQDYRFPFDDTYFDLVYLVSVFSHMLPPDMEHYLGEIGRVLKPGGTCISTFFLYDQATQEHLDLGRPLMNFRYKGENYLTSNPDNPESAIAYDKTYIERIFSQNNLAVRQKLRLPAIPGMLMFLTEQDILVATRVA